jgi:hypothetical protein
LIPPPQFFSILLPPPFGIFVGGFATTNIFLLLKHATRRKKKSRRTAITKTSLVLTVELFLHFVQKRLGHKGRRNRLEDVGKKERKKNITQFAS